MDFSILISISSFNMNYLPNQIPFLVSILSEWSPLPSPKEIGVHCKITIHRQYFPFVRAVCIYFFPVISFPAVKSVTIETHNKLLNF